MRAATGEQTVEYRARKEVILSAGFTDWIARLTLNAKERLLISGYGLDRLAYGYSGRDGRD
jgi:hypothetical protein